ncbi:MAG: sugar ABC transporter ATP-binding protein [Spirochaetales bacterium]|uniref:Sugar ABC transporter ATP-binding protein n=1 Tax=Candidatus Thalassospirochaeta sargassi TaxID=3119039 RepID=A0AAJ1IBL1_9SPIO|nr:sugar ABC transporter ATP-binding protein [Spirochaetales bacterium]
MSEYLIEMKGINKEFPGVKALTDVDLNIKKGEIVCLLGENGAGKSTLMKILTGVYKQDGGCIYYDGGMLDFHSTRDAYEQGINIIFQEFNLCPNMTAMENVFLGNENKTKSGLLSYKETRSRAEEFFNRLKIDIKPDDVVEKLGVAQQQMIEIAKALAYDTKVLIMDEPTSALAEKEIENLFIIMRELKERGISIIFISHKLDEVLEITDRVVILRDGENAGEVQTKEATEETLVSVMVGREMSEFYTARKSKPSDEIIFEAEGLCGPPHIKDASFKIKKGEILGLAGLVGAGRTELAKLIIGAEKKTAGRIIMNGQELNIKSPKDSVAARIAYLPEDRKNLGLVLPMTVRENTTLSIHNKVSNMMNIINSAKEKEVTDKYIKGMKTKVSSREQVVETLSGGNQQKVVIAKSLALEPELLILDEPTRGIDVGAKAEVHNIISDLADEGMAVIVISSELPEVFHLADRILVMHEGEITADLMKDEADQEMVMHAAIGAV